MRRLAPPKYDVLVVGGGLGGSFAACRLSERGLSVLVLEAGSPRRLPAGEPSWKRALRRRLGRTAAGDPDRWPEELRLYLRRRGAAPRRLEAFLGRGPGGSSAIYSAALGRLRRSDFAGAAAPLAHTDGELPLPDAWPVPFDEVRSYYAQVEAAMRLVGENDPLDADDTTRAAPGPALSARDAAIRRRLVENGLHPYRLKVGFDYLAGCEECPGRRCPRQCKADGYSRALWQALATGRVRLETGTRVRSIAPQGDGLCVLAEREDGTLLERTAQRVVLAAGALNTPLLLARSERLWERAPPPAVLGRGLMFHVSDIFTVRVPGRPDRTGPKKTLALRDFYPEAAGGLGEMQSIGVDIGTGLVMSRLREWARAVGLPGLCRAVEALRPLAWVLAKLAGPTPVLATITEDLPYASNRVWEEPDAGGGIALSYAPSPALRDRVRRLRKQVRRAFAPFRVVFLTRPAKPNWGHPMGTCRMGEDPATSVVTPDGHLWDHPQIFVADASVFPSSGGAGPSLTVAALALRAADRLADRYARRSPAAEPVALAAASASPLP